MLATHSLVSKALTRVLKYNYLPVSNYRLEDKSNPKIQAKFMLGDQQYTTRIELFQNKVPKTAGNFKKLLLGSGEYKQRKLSLAGLAVSKIYPSSHVEFEDMQGGNLSIYGERFADQSWEDLHDTAGLVSSVSDGNTNSSKFVITLGPCPVFDYKYVVFGRILDLDILQKLQAQATATNNLKSAVKFIGATQTIDNDHHGHPVSHH